MRTCVCEAFVRRPNSNTEARELGANGVAVSGGARKNGFGRPAAKDEGNGSESGPNDFQSTHHGAHHEKLTQVTPPATLY
eukprot:SAG11_NODE_10012_length_862_cov_2.904325_2_plen_80_part_00